ncbi:dihydrofolate reductase [Mesorhizobium loti]|nr:dihydrofolate reductase [Mesorhizobium loti]
MTEIETRLDTAYQVHRLFDAAQHDGIEAARGNIRAVVTGGGTGLANDWIDRLPLLGIIAVNGVGTDRIDLAYARKRNVHVTTTQGALTDEVADMGLALILAVLRRIVEGDRFLRNGRWHAGEQFPLGSSPRGKRLGVLGLGQIGRALGTRAEVFGMAVRYSNRTHYHDVAWPHFADATALAADSDVLAVCVAATPDTRRVVNDNVLKALGPQGTLINIARGSVVDEEALIAALRDGTIAAAGLDVFENEPAIRKDFLELPNVVLMPHQASATVETRRAMGNMVLASLDAYFTGRQPENAVN